MILKDTESKLPLNTFLNLCSMVVVVFTRFFSFDIVEYKLPAKSVKSKRGDKVCFEKDFPELQSLGEVYVFFVF